MNTADRKKTNFCIHQESRRNKNGKYVGQLTQLSTQIQLDQKSLISHRQSPVPVSTLPDQHFKVIMHSWSFLILQWFVNFLYGRCFTPVDSLLVNIYHTFYFYVFFRNKRVKKYKQLCADSSQWMELKWINKKKSQTQKKESHGRT